MFFTISIESKVTFRSSKINIFVESNTEKTLTKTAPVPNDNDNNYTVLKISYICLAGIKLFKVSTVTSSVYSILKGYKCHLLCYFQAERLSSSPRRIYIIAQKILKSASRMTL